MKPEQKVWQRLRPHLQAIPGLKYERIESKVSGNGIPDVYCSHRTVGAFWLELKADTTPDQDVLCFPATESGWRPTQRRWAADSWARGVPVFLVIGKMVDGRMDPPFFIDTRDVLNTDRIDIIDKRVRICSFVTGLCASGITTAGGK